MNRFVEYKVFIIEGVFEQTSAIRVVDELCTINNWWRDGFVDGRRGSVSMAAQRLRCRFMQCENCQKLTGGSAARSEAQFES